MANWRIIERTGQTLIQLLESQIKGAFPQVSVKLVSTTSFDYLASTDKPTISLLLYQINEATDMRNALQRLAADGSLQRQPLALELCYMVTPWGARTGQSVEDDVSAVHEEQQLIGLILKAFYDNANIGSADLFDEAASPVWSPADNLQILLETLPLEDHYRIWDAAELGYRVSVTYRVRVLGLYSDETLVTRPVSESTLLTGTGV